MKSDDINKVAGVMVVPVDTSNHSQLSDLDEDFWLNLVG